MAVNQLAIILTVIAFFCWIIFQWGEKSGQSVESVKQQKNQIEIQNEIIKDKKNISQRQAVARAVSTNDNIVWLRQYRCKDCKSR